ncbi:PREDICTED: glutathione S-transferase A3-like [Hipposideros armiger]|uniref:glutathione transferase n=1 Tax=Hipposideros armiger TaxID=186990 RepID=A0A8B7SLK9_HIPAR|nr:PREDICTED: glutathione S-transferase A3-like [Hipposideros armiger]
MAGKPRLHYYNGRGRMDSIHWLLAAAGVEFEEKFIETPEDLEKLSNDGSLMFQQVPMVEIDGMKLVQSRAIINYIASKYNLYGRDIKEKALIDMYAEGMADLNEMFILLPLSSPDKKDAEINLIIQRATNRYFPAFEKVSGLCRSLCFCALQALKTRISNLPTVKKFLQPGSTRKPPIDDKTLEKLKKIFKIP